MFLLCLCISSKWNWIALTSLTGSRVAGFFLEMIELRSCCMRDNKLVHSIALQRSVVLPMLQYIMLAGMFCYMCVKVMYLYAAILPPLLLLEFCKTSLFIDCLCLRLCLCLSIPPVWRSRQLAKPPGKSIENLSTLEAHFAGWHVRLCCGAGPCHLPTTTCMPKSCTGLGMTFSVQVSH